MKLWKRRDQCRAGMGRFKILKKAGLLRKAAEAGGGRASATKSIYNELLGHNHRPSS
jgi:hypothetical protein